MNNWEAKFEEAKREAMERISSIDEQIEKLAAERKLIAGAFGSGPRKTIRKSRRANGQLRQMILDLADAVAEFSAGDVELHTRAIRPHCNLALSKMTLDGSLKRVRRGVYCKGAS